MLNSSDGSDGSSKMDPPSSLIYYPIYMHKAHPLHGAWVKLSAKLVGDLVVPPGWEASHPAINIAGAAPLAVSPKFPLFYYLNHPLPYVQVCGVVVEVTERFSFTELRLDDSSGVLATALFKKWIDLEEAAKQQDASDATEAKPGDLLTIPIPTKKDIRYCSWLSDNTFDIQNIKIGSVLRIKGRASFWKLGIQILIEKYDIFRSTSQEIEFWRSMSRDFKNVLSKPWLLADQHAEELEADFQRTKNAKEKQMAQMRRRARRERKEKDAAADGDRKGKKRLEDETRRGKLAKTSIDAVLAPSYQVPQKGSSSETKSSLDPQPLAVIEESTDATLSIRPNMEVNEHEAQSKKTAELARKETGSDQAEEFTTSRLLESALGSSLFYHTKSPITAGNNRSSEREFVDTGSPSQWKQIGLMADAEADATRLIRGAEWLTLRNDLSSRRLLSKDKQSKSVQEKASKYSITDEWNDVVL